MVAEEVARKFEFSRSDFTLIGYEEVALPFYRVKLRVFTLEHKPIPPIEEFVLGAIRVGLVDEESLAGFLGLPLRIVRGVLAGLLQNEAVHLSASIGERRQEWRLTPSGLAMLQDAEIVVPEEHTFEIDFDGLMRRVVSYRQDVSVQRRLVRESGWLEVPSHPAKAPELSEIGFRQVAESVRASGRGKEKRELLSISAVERRDHLFRPAVALVYQSRANDRVEVGLFVDGRPAEELGLAFAKSGGLTALGMDQVRGRESLPRLKAGVVPTPDLDQNERLRESVWVAEEVVETLREDVNRSAGIAELQETKSQLAEAEEQLRAARQAIEQQIVRFIPAHEHGTWLRRALVEAKDRVLIISPWLSRAVIDMEFLHKVQLLLHRGVRLYVGYGIGGDQERPDREGDRQSERKLDDLARRFDNFDMHRIGNTHEKVLVCDSKFVIVSSFNWLSFKGDRNRGIRHERGVVVTDPIAVETEFQVHLKKFNVAPSS